MFTQIAHDWAPVIEHQNKHRARYGYVRLTTLEARALVALDVHLNGYQELMTCRGRCLRTFTDAYDLDQNDLVKAVLVGIHRSTKIAADDPAYREKNALRATYAALLGTLDKATQIVVGTAVQPFWPQADA